MKLPIFSRITLSLVVAIAYLVGGVAPLQAQYVMMPDSTNNRLVLFDSNDGSVFNPNYFGLAGGTPIHAIQVDNEIWISEQVGDRVSRWSLTGSFLGAITGGLDNIRGMGKVGGTVYVTNFGTANSAPGPAVISFDTAGNNLGFFATNSTSPSPFAVLRYQSGLLVASSQANDDIHYYSSTGTSLGTFHNSSGLNFAEQMAYRNNGNILVAGFSSPTGIYELDATTGNIVSSWTASGPRGVYQLTNGNILWTNGSGAFVLNPVSGISTQVYTGGGRFLDFVNLNPVPEPTSGLLLCLTTGLSVFIRRRAC